MSIKGHLPCVAPEPVTALLGVVTEIPQHTLWHANLVLKLFRGFAVCVCLAFAGVRLLGVRRGHALKSGITLTEFAMFTQIRLDEGTLTPSVLTALVSHTFPVKTEKNHASTVGLVAGARNLMQRVLPIKIMGSATWFLSQLLNEHITASPLVYLCVGINICHRKPEADNFEYA